MIYNFIVIAVRFYRKNFGYLFINLLGLGLGLLCFFLAMAVAEYENSHDSFFANSDRIFSAYTNVTPAAGFGVPRVYGAPPIMGPLIKENVPNLKAVARYTESRELVKSEDRVFYESVKFVDPEFFGIFSFDYLSGSRDGVLEDGASVIITRDAANKYFGGTNVVGHTMAISGGRPLRVSAVIENLPLNSHFTYRFGTADRMQIIAPMAVYERIKGAGALDNWEQISDISRIYMLLAEGVLPERVGANISTMWSSHGTDRAKEIISSFGLIPLTQINAAVWDAGSFSLITAGIVFAALLLLVAVFNFANSYSAIVFGRAREWGLRSVLGATKTQLGLQVFLESLAITAIASLVAYACAELLIPLFNATFGKDVALSFLSNSWLIVKMGVAIFVISLFAALHPISFLVRSSATDALRPDGKSGPGGSKTRSIMVMLQFVAAYFLTVIMTVTYLQNRHLVETDLGFSAEGVITIKSIDQPDVRAKYATLRDALEARPEISLAAGVETLPFEQVFQFGKYGLASGNKAEEISFLRSVVDFGFFESLEVPILSGRYFDPGFAQDTGSGPIDASGEIRSTNVVINRAAAERFGWKQADEAVGKIIYAGGPEAATRAYTIVGVVADSNFHAFANDIKATVFHLRPDRFASMIVRPGTDDPTAAMKAVTEVWAGIYPGQPLISGFLEEDFDARYDVYTGANTALAGLAALAIGITSFGLFGLASLYASSRKREVVIRKVLGASRTDLHKFLSWQFVKPVLWSFAFALPLSALVSNQYLSLFPDRIDSLVPTLVGVAVIMLALSLITVSGHVFRLARIRPALLLRYE